MESCFLFKFPLAFASLKFVSTIFILAANARYLVLSSLDLEAKTKIRDSNGCDINFMKNLNRAPWQKA